MVASEVPNIVICLGNFWYFGKLVAEEKWAAAGGSTVHIFLSNYFRAWENLKYVLR